MTFLISIWLRNITQWKRTLINLQELREKPVSDMNTLIYMGDTLLSSSQMPYYLVFRIGATLRSIPISNTYFHFCLCKILLIVYQKGPQKFKSSGALCLNQITLLTLLLILILTYPGILIYGFLEWQEVDPRGWCVCWTTILLENQLGFWKAVHSWKSHLKL